jgi:hypothetical protein
MAKKRDKRERSRINIDVDPALKDAIRELSYELGIPESQIYQLFAAEGVLEAKKEKASIWNPQNLETNWISTIYSTCSETKNSVRGP